MMRVQISGNAMGFGQKYLRFKTSLLKASVIRGWGVNFYLKIVYGTVGRVGSLHLQKKIGFTLFIFIYWIHPVYN